MALAPITSDGPTILVSTSNELLDAYIGLSTQSGGGTILLEDGYYGSHSLYGSFGGDEPVIIASADADNPAVFESIYLHNVSNVRIEGIHVDSSSNGGAGSSLIHVASGSTNIQIVDVEVNGKVDATYDGHYGIRISDSSNVGVYGADIHDVKNGIYASYSDGIEVIENTLNYLGNDGMKFSGVTDVLIQNNIGPQYVFPVEGAHLDFIQFQGSDSSDIVISGNLLLPGNWTDLQGIFMDDAHYTNVLIEQNIIVTGMIRGISVSSGTNVVARDNTVLDIDGYGSKATKVIVDGDSYGNIQSSYLQDAGEGTNLTLQQTHPDSPLHYDDVFVNADAGMGMAIEDLIPTEGSLAYEYGATERLAELLNTAFATPTEDPPVEAPPAEDPPAEDPLAEDPPAEDPGDRRDAPDPVVVDDRGVSFISEFLEMLLSLFGLGSSDNPAPTPLVETSESAEIVLADVVPTLTSVDEQQPVDEEQPVDEAEEMDFAA